MFDISAKTKQLGIIGDPVDHSFSPVMHNYISNRVGGDYIYCAWHVKHEDVGAAIAGMRALGIRGINVTAPHKNEVMKYIDEISEGAKQLGSVNTIVNRGGILTGYNTDADGFCRALEYEGVTIEGANILVLGAGGASRPLCIRMAQHGAASITIVNRTHERAVAAAAYVSEIAGMGEIKAASAPEGRYDIVVNTTSAGMEPQIEACPLADMSFIGADTFVADIIYNPAETLFLRRARENGARTINGLGMLICQGIIAYELFTDIKLEKDMYASIRRDVFGA